METAARSAGDPAEDVTTEALALEARAGSKRAFGELVERLHAPLFHFLCLRVSDRGEAEEVVQESFLRAWLKLAHYDARWRFSTWLFTLAKRVAASRARRRRPHVVKDDALVHLETGSEPSALAEARDEKENVWRLAANVLPVEQRSALWLRYAEDLEIEEIARILGRPRVTVRVHLFRARETLARHLNARTMDGGRR